jgi:hypothetical protein
MRSRREVGTRLGWRATLVAILLGSSLVMMVSVFGFFAMSLSKFSGASNATAAAPWLQQ